MTVLFASADKRVVAQYDRLEDALKPCLPSRRDVDEDVDEEADQYLRSALLNLDRELRLPPVGSRIDRELGRRLNESFRVAVSLDIRENKKPLTAGDVSFYFSCLAYYILGPAEEDLSDLQKNVLLEACDIAETRPLPVIRWTEFVRSNLNLNDAARIRTVMRSCIYSKTLLSKRLFNVAAGLIRHFEFSKTPNVLAIGSSSTVRDALRGFVSARAIKVSATRPTPGIAFDQSGLGVSVEEVKDSALLAGETKQDFDLIVMGCGVIGKTPENQIEVVNWARDISVAREVRGRGAKLFIISGLYKIWPQSFYQSHKGLAMGLRMGPEATSTAVIAQNDMDWLVTEQGAVDFRKPDTPSWIGFLFDARSLDVTTSLSLCTDERGTNEAEFIQSILQNQNIYDIDKKLSLVTMEPGRRDADIKGQYAESRPHETALDTMKKEAPIHGGAIGGPQSGASSVASPEGGVMPELDQVEEDGSGMGFYLFKLGLLTMIVGWASWIALLASNKIMLALAASVVAAVGANILMLGVLGDRHDKEAESIQRP